MLIEITIPKTQIFFRQRGVYKSLVTAPMAPAQARALAPQYGFRADEVWLVRKLDMRYCRQVDDQALQQVLERYPANPNRTRQELLAIIRLHFAPHATRILRPMHRR